MDTLFWKQSCPNISQRTTNHLSYGQYAYKLVIAVNGANMLRYQTDFDFQLKTQRLINYGGSWRRRTAPNEQDIALLEKLRSYRSDLPAGMRMRVEEPHIQFYSTDEDKLKTLVQDVFVGIPADEYLTSISAPKSRQDLDLLNQGFVLRRANDYAFRMHLRDGKYPKPVKKQLLDLLDAQQDQVRVPPNTRNNLTQDRSDYLWGCYFWCQDESLRLLVDLIRPRTIRQIDRFLAPVEVNNIPR
jgi:hypothetical protein